jgi:phosphoribosylanthranilate isomerase
MKVRTKICGITRLEDALVAVEAGADALGFVFVPGTPRYVTPTQAAAIVRRLPPFVARVGLFVDAAPSVIRDTIADTGLDTVQLHGSESPELCAELGATISILKAFKVRDAGSLEAVTAYQEGVAAWLLDAFVPGAHGGTGTTFDWGLANTIRSFTKPVVIAGGLTPGNVARAVEIFQPYAVDVSSGVEASPGLKDPARIRAFLSAVGAPVPAVVP